ncbi:S-adenosyl-L-methionine-dependent methyltransferase, partial [Hygrophoropsis aurantiaca]
KPARVPKLTSSVHDISAEKPPFGSRFLTESSDVWAQNAWDHVPPPKDQAETITASLAKQRLAPVPDEEKIKYNEKPAKYWDNFYKTNANNFFRNRNWLHLEFPELLSAADSAASMYAGGITICEIGCGAGNAAFPLLLTNKNPKLTIRAYDYSSHAVKLVQTNPAYTSPPVGSIHAAVWDFSSDILPNGVEPGTVDIIVLVFVMSALHPDEWDQAIANVHKMLKPGGLVLFRDYGRHDLTQLRFKSGRLLEDNFYIRGDKTRVYFFELDELALLFTGSVASESQKAAADAADVIEETEGDDIVMPTGSSPATPANGTLHTRSPLSSTSSPPPLAATPESDTPFESDATSQTAATSETADANSSPLFQVNHPNLLRSSGRSVSHPLFTIEQLGIDRRLLVNRKRQLKMYRVWMQGKFKKLV